MKTLKALGPNGSKSWQRSDQEHRAQPFLEWHRKALDRRAYALDVDLIEWRFRDGKLVPAAVLEISRTDRKTVGKKYRSTILERIRERDLQGRASITLADHLKVPCYIVLFSKDCEDFWVYNLTADRGWWHLDAEKMAEFLNNL